MILKVADGEYVTEGGRTYEDIKQEAEKCIFKIACPKCKLSFGAKLGNVTCPACGNEFDFPAGITP